MPTNVAPFTRVAALWPAASGGGGLISTPDTEPLVVNRITAGQDIARMHNDAQAWSVNHLSSVISGGDPLQAIIEIVADYWAQQDERMVVSSLKGMFANESMAASLLKIASETAPSLQSVRAPAAPKAAAWGLLA